MVVAICRLTGGREEGSCERFATAEKYYRIKGTLLYNHLPIYMSFINIYTRPAIPFLQTYSRTTRCKMAFDRSPWIYLQGKNNRMKLAKPSDDLSSPLLRCH